MVLSDTIKPESLRLRYAVIMKANASLASPFAAGPRLWHVPQAQEMSSSSAGAREAPDSESTGGREGNLLRGVLAVH